MCIRKYIIQAGRFPAVEMRMSTMATAVEAIQRMENQNAVWDIKFNVLLLKE